MQHWLSMATKQQYTPVGHWGCHGSPGTIPRNARNNRQQGHGYPAVEVATDLPVNNRQMDCRSQTSNWSQTAGGGELHQHHCFGCHAVQRGCKQGSAN
jgi:hypothetical protein